MKFIVNRLGTKVWHEVPHESLVEWAADGDDRQKTAQKKVKKWTEEAKHGEIMVIGANRVVALSLDESQPSESPTTSPIASPSEPPSSTPTAEC